MPIYRKVDPKASKFSWEDYWPPRPENRDLYSLKCILITKISESPMLWVLLWYKLVFLLAWPYFQVSNNWPWNTKETRFLGCFSAFYPRFGLSGGHLYQKFKEIVLEVAPQFSEHDFRDFSGSWGWIRGLFLRKNRKITLLSMLLKAGKVQKTRFWPIAKKFVRSHKFTIVTKNRDLSPH